MTPPGSIIDNVVRLGFLQSFRWRLLIFGVLLLVTGLLTFFPERHLALSSFTPTDRGSLGLDSTLGELDAVRSVFGDQAAVEVALRVGNSDAVRDQVIDSSFLKDELEERGRVDLQRYLQENVVVRSLRGGIIVVEMEDYNASVAKELVGAYQKALQFELANISEAQTAYKRGVLERLVKEAAAELSLANAAYDSFRINNQYTEPRSDIAAIGEQTTALKQTIRSREIELASARSFYTDRNVVIRQREAELAALRSELAEALRQSPAQEQSLGEVVQNSSEVIRLERDLETARTLYYNYLRFLRGTDVEDLTADANLRLLEPPHVVTERQIYLPALALFCAVLLAWIAVEAYRFRPPPGRALASSQDD